MRHNAAVYGGTDNGLGLAIIAAHKGQVEVHRAGDKMGSEFSVRLPIQETEHF